MSVTNHPKYIIWHTAAHGKNGVDYDTTAAQIDQWHRGQGWHCIGYHYVIRKGGAIETGRAEDQEGAHVLGLNTESIGICFSGHGDIAGHTQAQRAAGLQLTRELMARYNISVQCVIGHREVNALVQAGILTSNCHVSKSCPGTRVDMDAVRAQLKTPAEVLKFSDEAAGHLFEHLRGVYAAIEELQLTQALDELNAFRREPGVDAVLAHYLEAHKVTE